MTTNGRAGAGKGTKQEDFLGAFQNLGKDVVDGFKEAIDEALNKSTAIRQADHKFGASRTARVEVRREGFRQRENPEDRKKADALKANRDRKVISAEHITDLAGYIVCGQQCVLDVAARLSDVTDSLPDHLRPLGENLTKASVQLLSTAFVESVKYNAETGQLETAEATQPGQRQR